MKDRLQSLYRHLPRTEDDGGESSSDLIDIPYTEETLNEETSEFLEKVLVQRHEVVRLRQAARRVGQLHHVLLAALNSGAPDIDAVDEAIKRLDDQFKEVDKISGSVCQAISNLKEEVRRHCDSPADCRIRKDQLMALTESVRIALVQFNKDYVDYEEASRKRALDYLKATKVTEEERVLEFFGDDVSVSSGNGPKFQGKTSVYEAVLSEVNITNQNQSVTDEERVLEFFGDDSSFSTVQAPQLQRSLSVYQAVLTEAKERHETIEKVERSIEELGDLFHQLKLYVDNGDDMANNIESNIDRAGEFVEKSRKNIAIVVEREENIRKGEGVVGKAIWGLRLLLIFLLVFLFLLVVALLWMFTRRLSISIN